MRALWRSVRELWPLAWPLALVQFNNNLTGAVDTAFAGRVDHLTLGATGLGASIFIAVSVLGLAAGMGMDPLAAQAFGGGEGRRARDLLWQGLWVASALALPLMAGLALLAHRLAQLGVEAELAAGARDYLLGRLPALPAYCLVGVLRSYLQAAKLTWPLLASALVMNGINVVADYLLLFGDAGLDRLGLPHLGLPAGGALGLGLASAVVAYVQLGLLAWATDRVVAPSHASAQVLLARPVVLARLPGPWAGRPSLQTMAQMLALGVPAALQMLAEVGIFSLVALLMGGMGATIAAAHHAALVLAGLSFSLCVGVGAATAVHVGRAVGRKDPSGTRSGGVAGLLIGQGTMAVAALAMWLCPHALAGMMVQDPEVRAAAARLVFIAGFFQLADGAQVVLAGALRGAGRTQYACVANLICHYGVGLPLAVWLTYRTGLGPEGLWWGLTAGLTAVAAALGHHFWRLSRHVILPVDAV